MGAKMLSKFGLILHCLIFFHIPATVFGSTAIYIGGFIAEGTFQDLTLDAIIDVTYDNDTVYIQNATSLAGCETKGGKLNCTCSEADSVWSGQECQDYRCCIPDKNGSNIFEGEFMIESYTNNASLQDLLNMYVYYLMEPKGKITDTLLIASCQGSGDKTQCVCESDLTWSNTVCENHWQCCNKPECVANISHYTPLCLPKETVELKGTITNSKVLKISRTSGYIDLGETIENAFKKLNGFNSSMVKVSSDNLTAEFSVTLNSVFKTHQLQDLINELRTNLSVDIHIISKGVAKMSKLSEGAPYKLECSMEEELTEWVHSWSVDREGYNITRITNGSKARITNTSNSNTRLELQEYSWAGLYICSFKNGSISHMASTKLDIPQLPDIILKSDPQTADCSIASNVDITVSCNILSSPNNFNITVKLNDGTEVISQKLNIQCKDSTSGSIYVKCTVIQHGDKPHNKTLEVSVLRSKDQSCPADGEWPKTKVRSTATLWNCPSGRQGNRSRTCKGKDDWGHVFDYCVREEVKNLLQSAESLVNGLENTVEKTSNIFAELKNLSNPENEATLGDVEAFVSILDSMMNATSGIKIEDNSVMNNFVVSANNILSMPWDGANEESRQNLSTKYLQSVEGLLQNIQVIQSTGRNTTLIQFQVRQQDINRSESISDVKLTLTTLAQQAKVLAIKNLTEKLPNDNAKFESSSIMVTVALEGNLSKPEDSVMLDFPLKEQRPRNHEIHCVQWQTSTNNWVKDGCSWITTKDNHRARCSCSHGVIKSTSKSNSVQTSRVTSFSTLMSKSPFELKHLKEISLTGLWVSVCSLVIFIFIEGLVWNSVTKSDIAYFRHMVLVNIAIFLLLANSCFLVSFFKEKLLDPWCLILAVAKHVFYLAMFFWMFCLSMFLLHQLIFVFSPVNRKTFFILSFATGYLCPLVTVGVTYLYYKLTAGSYHDTSSCWLKYEAPLEGSIHAFLIPVGVIILINLFAMVKVIVTHLRPQISEGTVDEKEMAKSILKVIAVLTPVFGITWILGFFVFFLDITQGVLPELVNYAFTITNSLQGFFILLTGLLGERKVLKEVLKRFSCSTSERSESKKHLTSSIQKHN